MNEIIFKTLKNKDYIVKNYLFKIVTDLKLDTNDMILLIYFMNQETPVLDVDLISKSVYLSQEDIICSFGKLTDMKIIEVKVVKENGKTKEVISLDNMVKYITTDIVKDGLKENNENLFSEFEKEFGRTISPMEYEIVNSWIKEGFSSELIEEALKEAVYHGAKNFKYVYAVLSSWRDKGYKSRNDIEKGLKSESKESKKNIFEYDWVNEEE